MIYFIYLYFLWHEGGATVMSTRTLPRGVVVCATATPALARCFDGNKLLNYFSTKKSITLIYLKIPRFIGCWCHRHPSHTPSASIGSSRLAFAMIMHALFIGHVSMLDDITCRPLFIDSTPLSSIYQSKHWGKKHAHTSLLLGRHPSTSSGYTTAGTGVAALSTFHTSD